MYAKLKITGEIEVLSGMHIGGANVFSAIGSVDSEVIKDPKSGHPMIPGSSLKGKMRSLLARVYNQKLVDKPDEDDEKIIKLFGCGKRAKDGKAILSKVIFTDSILDDKSLIKTDLGIGTEIKFENTINRCTAVANPRQIERVIRGSVFPLELIYEVTHYVENVEDYETQVIEDLELLGLGFKLLEYDYLGGNGTRGYGKVKFNDLKLTVVYGDVDQDTLALWSEAFLEAKGQGENPKA